MKRFLAEIILKYRYGSASSKREKRFVPWDKAEKIALILNNEDSINKSVIDRFIDQTEKFVEVFYVETDSKIHSFGDWNCFSRSDKNVLGLPKKKMLENFRNKKYDIVINTGSDRNLFSTAVSASLTGQLKCDSSEKYGYADLIIRKTEPYNLLQHLEHVIRYLKMLRA